MHYHEGTENLITVFGVLFVAALLAYWWLARRNVIKVGYDPSHMDLLLPLCVVGGITGGLLLSFLMPDDRQVAGEMLQVDTRVRLFGLVVSGAVVVYLYSRATRLSFRTLLDTLAYQHWSRWPFIASVVTWPVVAGVISARSIRG